MSLNENEDEIDEIVGAWTQLHSIEELERKLDEAAVLASRIYTMEDVFNDPHYAAREMIVDVPDDDLGRSSRISCRVCPSRRARSERPAGNRASIRGLYWEILLI